MNDSRFASIGDILSRPSTQTERRDQDPDTPGEDQWEPSPSDGGDSDASGPSSPEAGDRKSTASNGGVRRVALRLDPLLHRALAAKVAVDRTSQGEVVLDAVEGVLESGRLADLIEQEHSRQHGQGLFPRLRPRGRPTATIPVELRLDARAVAALDELAKDLGAESRTELIAVALKDQLGTDLTGAT